MALNYTALKNEILTDPSVPQIGYAPFVASGADANIAELLNAAITGNAIFRNDVRSEEIWEAINATEFNALTSIALQRLSLILAQAGARGALDVRGTNLRGMLGGIFPAGSATRAALVTLSARNGSRAETLFGTGVFIAPDDVAKALRG